MSKRTRTSKNEKWIKDRGLGIGSEYKTWLNIPSVSYLGQSIRLKGIETGKQNEF